MTTRFVCLMAVGLAGCSTGYDTTKGKQLETDVADLQVRVEALETDNRALQTQVTSLSDELASAQATLAAVDDLLQVMSINADGDVVVDGANLRVQNGTGSTAGEMNGKGNIYVGYNEQGTCVGGANPGARCGDGIAVCAGGTCDPGTGSETTGSHNLVVGSWIAHSSYAGLGVGRSHVLNAPQCAAVGAGNTCGAAKAFLAGRANNASGESCSVLGGTGGTCSGTESVVVGGLENEASADQGIVP